MSDEIGLIEKTASQLRGREKKRGETENEAVDVVDEQGGYSVNMQRIIKPAKMSVRSALIAWQVISDFHRPMSFTKFI